MMLSGGQRSVSAALDGRALLVGRRSSRAGSSDCWGRERVEEEERIVVRSDSVSL